MRVQSISAILTAIPAIINALPAPAPVAAAVPAPFPSPIGIPSSSTAKSYLSSLTVSPSEDDGEYKRSLFPTWDTITGNCNTREYVLQRDGTDVVTSSTCAAISGSWYSPYDGVTKTAASGIDIDHMVPLKNAWISGANKWTTSKREQYANDITRPQLWAVSASVNRSKGDNSPDAWKPPVTSFHCTYAKSWVAVKYYWDLTITSDEESALASMLDTC